MECGPVWYGIWPLMIWADNMGFPDRSLLHYHDKGLILPFFTVDGNGRADCQTDISQCPPSVTTDTNRQQVNVADIVHQFAHGSEPNFAAQFIPVFSIMINKVF